MMIRFASTLLPTLDDLWCFVGVLVDVRWLFRFIAQCTGESSPKLEARGPSNFAEQP